MEKMTGHTRLYRRGATYYHRASIPSDIKDTYKKSEETSSLKTKDYHEALKLVRLEAVRVDKLFETHRQCQKLMNAPKVEELTRDQIKAVGERYYIHLLDEDETLRLEDGFYNPDEPLPEYPIPSYIEYKDTNLSIETHSRELLATASPDTFFTSEAKEVLGWTDIAIPLTEYSKSWRVLALELVKQTVLARKAITERNNGEIIETPKLSESPKLSPVFSEITKVWFEEKARDINGWREKTAMSNQKALEAFVECVGDKHLSDYKLADATNFKHVLMALPANWVKHKELHSLPIYNAALKAKELGLEPQSIVNINKNLGFVKAFWRWASSNYEGLSKDIFDGAHIKRIRKQKDDRYPFTTEELQKIFNSTVYMGCISESRWKDSGDFSMRNTAKFWLPLLALYTGARAGELLQLRASDIMSENDIWLIDVNEDHIDKKVKAREARRVPIHNSLIRFGFLKFVEGRKCHKADMLFPDAKLGQDGYYSSPFSKYFNRFLSDAGVKTDKNAFHSFRHNFTDAGRNCGADMSVIAEIQGHQGHRTQDNYGAGYYLETAKQEIDKLSYTGLDLKHLEKNN